MAETETKRPAAEEPPAESGAAGARQWPALGTLRTEIDRLFEDFDQRLRSPFRRSLLDIEPFWRRETGIGVPAVDIADKGAEYELTAEMPGIEEKDVEVKIAGGMLTIRGEKRETKEEKKKDYFVSERRYGSFQRSFRLPEGVDPDRIEAHVKNGVLSVRLPKTPEAQQPEKSIEVKSG